MKTKSMKIKGIKTRRMSALLLAMIMLFTCLTGCGKTNAGDSAGGINGATDAGGVLSENAGESGSYSQHADGASGMGRYMEEVTDLSDRITGYGNKIYKLSDGRLVISDNYKPFLISEDNGATWEEDESLASKMAVGTDNTVVIIYDDGFYYEKEDKYIAKPSMLVTRSDGTENLYDVPHTKDGKYPHNIGIADNGRIFFSVLRSSDIYEIKEDGSCEYFMTVQGESPELMQFQGNLMFLDGLEYESPLIYDIEKNEYVEDEILAGFIKENYPDGNDYNGSEVYKMYFFPGEKGVMYIAGKKGLYRHVIGGSAMEQVIDGSLCSLSNPSHEITGMVMLPDDEFLTVFNSGKLTRYAYDPNVPTVPDNKLKVYSLKENDTIRMAIALFLSAHNDIAVEYEIGMEEGGSVTREDAIKSLNTKIMAGEGPDVLILDDMPIDSYIEKSMLMDLGTILSGLSGEEEVFENIVQAMKKDNKVYAMPCEIQIPVMMGGEKYISQIKDLESTADVMEELRNDNQGKELLSICTEKGIMRYFAMSCVPAWTTENGELDREAIAEFLEQTKRIYDAQTDGLPEETIEHYKVMNEIWLEIQGECKDDSSFLRTDDNGIDYVGGTIQLTYSALPSVRAYDGMVSINKVEGFEDSKWTIMNGQSSNVFCAKTLLGINAVSENADSAADFIRLCLGRENQSYLNYGLAVNKAAFDENFTAYDWMDENKRYAWVSLSNDEGVEFTINVYQSNEEQIADLRKCMETADTPYMEDTVLENAVYEEGILYMQGAQSLEEAVSAIEKRIAIYMAE